MLWTYAWENPKPGGYTIQVRAKDKKGEVQTAKVTRAMPDGATGYHKRLALGVRVRGQPSGNWSSNDVSIGNRQSAIGNRQSQIT